MVQGAPGEPRGRFLLRELLLLGLRFAATASSGSPPPRSTSPRSATPAAPDPSGALGVLVLSAASAILKKSPVGRTAKGERSPAGGEPSRDEQPDGDVGHHPGEILIGGEDELSVLDSNGGDHEVRDADAEDALRDEAVPEPKEVVPESVALQSQRESVEQPPESAKGPGRSGRQGRLRLSPGRWCRPAGGRGGGRAPRSPERPGGGRTRSR